MHPDGPDANCRRECRGRRSGIVRGFRGARLAIAGRAQCCEEALSRSSYQHRIAQLHQSVHRTEQLPVLPWSFRKADAGIQVNLFLCDARRLRSFNSLFQPVDDVADDILTVVVVALGTGELSGFSLVPMHEDDRQSGFRSQREHVGVCQTAGDVVEYTRSMSFIAQAASVWPPSW